MKNLVKIKLTKLSERKDAEVPNNIQEGEYRIGYVDKDKLKPIVGLSYVVPAVEQINDEAVSPIFHYFYTSQVIEIIDELTFKTLNSIYKIELL